MAVNSYSLKMDGETKLAENFRVREFACHDGSDAILIDSALVTLLQNIRDHFGRSLAINSAYRTKTYNQSIGGSTASQHVNGRAADIAISSVNPLMLAQYAEYLQAGGIGLYAGFVHVDTRENRTRWQSVGGKMQAAAGFYGYAPNYAAIVQQRAGLNDNTMAYLSQYKYGPELLEKLARAMQ